MWYEIIPAFALVAVGLTVPPVAGYGLNYLFNKGKVFLNIITLYTYNYYLKNILKLT